MVRDVVAWWLTCSVLGWLTWPLAARMFAHSPGRGYAYARTMSLVLLAYLYWLPGVLGLWPNQDIPLWGVAALVALAGLVAGLCRRAELGQWLRREWRQLLVTELLFIVALVFYAWYKAHDPAIDHTEEPMDFAFLTAMLRSPQLPPSDPWMAGLKISYYYLGYLIISLVGRLSGTPAGIAYNLGLAQTFALAVVGGYGVVHDLLARRRCAKLWGVLGGVSLGLAGNLEGLFELLHSRGLGGVGFYRWLDIPGLVDAPVTGSWLPQDAWWWWRASRIISDPNILLRSSTVITEFPAFSFILGDMHPHVMALPALFLALGLALEVYRSAHRGPSVSWWRRGHLWIVPLFLGALGMINSWDLPTVLLVAGLAWGIGRWRGRADGWRWMRDTALWGAWLCLGSILLYGPFFRNLSSQAQGIGLAYYAKTPLKQYLIQFAPWIIPILGEVAIAWCSLVRSDRRIARWLWLLMLLAPWLGTLIAGGWGRFLLGLVTVALRGPWLVLLQSLLLAALLTSLWRWLAPRAGGAGGAGPDPTPLGGLPLGGLPLGTLPLGILPLGDGTGQDRQRQADAQAADMSGELEVWTRLLMVLGLGLTYGTEFIYLRDFFDTRMNTMFKFYYQAWVLLGVGAVLAAYRLAQQRGWRRGVVVVAAVMWGVCLGYPFAAGITRASAYGGPVTLDSTEYLRREDPTVYGAYRWLSENAGPKDILVEAVGEDYDAHSNRLSAWTGVPTILGWPGHEIQWRFGVDMQQAKMDIGEVAGDAADIVNGIDGSGGIVDGDDDPFPVTHGEPP